jgi:ABC-type nitrate/sulfonate/bicarbonate transport system permease component
MKRLKSIESNLTPIAFFMMILLGWQYIVDKGIIARYILPSPSDVIRTSFKIFPELKPHIITTLEEAFTGFFIAIFLAMILAILMDSFHLLKKSFYPLFVVSQTIPIIVLVPLLVMWFGFGKLPKIIVVILVCFFPIVVNLLEGLQSIDRDMLNLFKSMKANYFQVFKFAKFPASLGNFFSGLKIAATYSIMGAVIGEWMGGKDGLGVYMTRVRQSFALDKVFSVIIIIVLLSLILFKTIELVQYLVMPWIRESK